MLIFCGIQSWALIQAFGQLCGLRPMADRMKGKEMPVRSGIRRLALIQTLGQLCGLRPLVDRTNANIYAVAIDIRSGKEAPAKIGLRLYGLEARGGRRKTNNIEYVKRIFRGIRRAVLI